jgi:hypothetical protein
VGLDVGSDRTAQWTQRQFGKGRTRRGEALGHADAGRVADRQELFRREAALRTPAEPIIPGAKREPSSFIQATISTGCRNAIPDSRIASIASSAASTPYTPSNLPPVGWLSRCEPVITGGASASVPSRRRKRLPMASVAALMPSALAQAITSRHAANSSARAPAG